MKLECRFRDVVKYPRWLRRVFNACAEVMLDRGVHPGSSLEPKDVEDDDETMATPLTTWIPVTVCTSVEP